MGVRAVGHTLVATIMKHVHCTSKIYGVVLTLNASVDMGPFIIITITDVNCVGVCLLQT